MVGQHILNNANMDEISIKLSSIVAELKTLNCKNRIEFQRIYELWEGIRFFDEMLYLTGLFIKGELNCTYYHMAPIVKNHESALTSLMKLNELGVITTNGQVYLNEDNHIQRSYLSFVLHVDNDFDYMAFSKKLFDKGLIVAAHIDMNTSILFDDEYQGLLTWGSKEKSYCVSKSNEREYTFVHSYCYTEYDIENKNERVYCATIASRNWDNLECDQVLIDILTE